MTDLTPAGFSESAREFAATALDAHVAGNFRRVALDAGTALEHLLKACLASRSPALLTELRGESNFPSLLALLGIAASPSPGQMRTVSLRDALVRVSKLVPSTAPMADLALLIDMRDGTVHAAQSDEVEERVVAAFIQHSDVLIADLGIDRAAYWGSHLTVVDALLAEARDKVAHRVAVKLAAAHARLEARSAADHPEMLKLARRLADTQSVYEWDTAPSACPVCTTTGTATGTRDVRYDYEGDAGNWPADERSTFTCSAFKCTICGLRLDSAAEMEEADMVTEFDEN